MAETTATKASAPVAPPPWRLGDSSDGLQGSVQGVLKRLAEDTKLPEHFRRAISEGIAAALEGTDHNYLVLHGSGHADHAEKGRRHLVFLDIQTSKELL